MLGFETKNVHPQVEALSTYTMRPHMDSIAYMDPEPPSKCRDVSWPLKIKEPLQPSPDSIGLIPV